MIENWVEEEELDKDVVRLAVGVECGNWKVWI